MAYLSALGASHETRFASGERREVVVVEVAFAIYRVYGVYDLIHPLAAEGGDIHYLSFAPLKYARPVSQRQHSSFGVERADVGGASPVYSHAFCHDALTDGLFADRPQSRLDLRFHDLRVGGFAAFASRDSRAVCLAGGSRVAACTINCTAACRRRAIYIVPFQARQHFRDHLFVGFGAFFFVAQLLYFHRPAARHASHGFQHFRRSVAEGCIIHHGLDSSRGDELPLQRDSFSYPLLGTLQPVG